MTASIVNPELSASSHRRSPSTKIDSSILPSRTARARRSSELSRLVIFIVCRGAPVCAPWRTLRSAPTLIFNLRPDRPMVRNIQRLHHVRTLYADALYENPIRMKAQPAATPRRRPGLKLLLLPARSHHSSYL